MKMRMMKMTARMIPEMIPIRSSRPRMPSVEITASETSSWSEMVEE